MKLKIIRILFYLMLLLFLLDSFDLFQTKIGLLKMIIYYGILLMPIPILLIDFQFNRNITKRIVHKVIPILTIIWLVYLKPTKILFHSQPWKTQIVKCIDKKSKNHKMEFQTKDIGALGYAKRNVEVYYFSKYFYIILSKNQDDQNCNESNWKARNIKHI